jgi:hypothetical protein
MVHVGFMQHSMGTLTSMSSAVMNCAAIGIILTALVNMELLSLGEKFRSVRTVSIMLIHMTNRGSKGGGFLWWWWWGGSYLNKLQGRDFMRQKINYNSLRNRLSCCVVYLSQHVGIPVFLLK